MRLKLFLTFVLLCVVPLLVLSAIVSFLSLRNARRLTGAELQNELRATTTAFKEAVEQHRRELRTAGQNATLIEYLRSHQTADETAASTDHQEVAKLSESLSPFLLNRDSLLSLACFNRAKRLVFNATKSSNNALRIETFPVEKFAMPESQTNGREIECEVAAAAATGKVLRCTTPLSAGQQQQIGLLLSEVKLDALFAEIAPGVVRGFVTQNPASADQLLVLDSSGEIVFHNNDALKHQPVAKVFPEFQSVAQRMTEGANGYSFYRGANGDVWYTAHAPLSQPGLFTAVGKNYSEITGPLWRNAWLSVGLSVLLGMGMATVLAVLYRRRTRSIQRVTRGIAAIAEGDLETQIEARSRDDIRDLAQGVNAVTNRLREQLARETEMRQIQSFVRVAAMLTHDLKNAINGLSMYVSNLEEQFENPSFRAESIKALTDATQKLQSLVDRLSNPIPILSGEYKRPRPTDLVTLVREVIATTIEPSRTKHQVQLRLPDSLIALVDRERIHTVIENLILNALEAMSGGPGMLTISGEKEPGRVVLSISDTGVGMTEKYIEQKLFHAFATTKTKGMGLGLYTCREVVTANGGSIEVTSKVGDGTTFRVVLPSPPSNKTEA